MRRAIAKQSRVRTVVTRCPPPKLSRGGGALPRLRAVPLMPSGEPLGIQTPYDSLREVLGQDVSLAVMAARDQEPQATLHPRCLARAGRSPSARWLMLCAAAVVTALTAAAAAQSAPAQRLKTPSLDAIGRAAGPIRDTIVRAPAKTLSLAPSGYWGGPYKVASGETVTVYASNGYPVDPALGQRWADFLGSLVHGPEISTVNVLLSTSAQIARVCGGDALACYSPQGALLYAPGDDPSSDLSPEAVITHEYGHHVAANRNNNPWDAADWGPEALGVRGAGLRTHEERRAGSGRGGSGPLRGQPRRGLGGDVPGAEPAQARRGGEPVGDRLAVPLPDRRSGDGRRAGRHQPLAGRHEHRQVGLGHARVAHADVHVLDSTRWLAEGDSEIFGGPAGDPGRLRIVDARRARGRLGNARSLDDRVRRP
jgi:hypothetical protein